MYCTCTYTCTCIYIRVGWEDQSNRITESISILSLQSPFNGLLRFNDVLRTQNVPYEWFIHANEWKLKVKTESSVCRGIRLNDHGNPYIESTTILSDNGHIHVHVYTCFNERREGRKKQASKVMYV